MKKLTIHEKRLKARKKSYWGKDGDMRQFFVKKTASEKVSYWQNTGTGRIL